MTDIPLLLAKEKLGDDSCFDILESCTTGVESILGCERGLKKKIPGRMHAFPVWPHVRLDLGRSKGLYGRSFFCEKVVRFFASHIA